MDFWLVSLGSGIGSLLRYGVTFLAQKLWSQNSFVGTLIINWSGSFLLAYFWACRLTGMETSFWGSGVLGGWTTFSTLNKDLLTLGGQKRWWVACLYGGLSYVGGILIAMSGYYLGQRS
ncbi:CrcB family protein [Lactobacillus sp. DCY120]|uniref:Fluoride-specific ion channel FluC n=1 Tax=Bombilactobacillus apium TaxID=2675299 RepID=A0A850QY89_9LACO|nr:CrcB family protein [Bombilactobacillus apium]NVY95623.1 CrcB family protein [Bombilactobacillus apium]